MSGYVDGVWREDGALAVDAVARMHLELKVESLRTGNELQDREMWKLIDSKRFPKIVAELRELSAEHCRGATPRPDKSRWRASRAVTKASCCRRETGEYVRIAGDINVDVRDFGSSR